MTLPIDWAALARMVHQDRARTGLAQGPYGAQIGLSQSEVSRLETEAFRELSLKMSEALKARFGEIPERLDAVDAELEERLVSGLDHIRREFLGAIGRMAVSAWTERLEHMERQASFLVTKPPEGDEPGQKSVVQFPQRPPGGVPKGRSGGRRRKLKRNA